MWRNSALTGVNQNQLFVADWDSNLSKYIVNTLVDTATDANDANVSFDLRQVKTGSGDGRYVTGIGDLMNGVADSWIYDCQENKAYSLQKMILDLGGPAVNGVVVEGMSLDGSMVCGYLKVKSGYVTPGGQTPVENAFVPFAIKLGERGISGQVTLQDWYGAVAGKSVDVVVTDGNTTENNTVTLDANGEYFVPTDLPAGSITVSIKASHWLNKSLATTLGTSGLSGADVSLINGDVDGDNAVTIFDYSALSTHFDMDSSAANWNTVDPNTGTKPSDSDLDGDEFVSIFDYSILSTNFDMMGD